MAKTRSVILSTLAALLIGCGGGPDGSTPIVPSITPAPPVGITPAPPVGVAPDDLIVPPGEAGKLGAFEALRDLPPDTPFEWTTDANSGWVFPGTGKTDSRGQLPESVWIPGFPGAGKLILTLREAGEDQVFEYATLSVAPEHPPWSGITVAVDDTPAATGYSIDMTPLTEPLRSYYAALNWSSGYAGLQRDGDSYDRQLQFSLWDASGDRQPEVVQTANGLNCHRFTHEGTGLQCQAEYPWSVGTTYRFELTVEEEGDASLFSLRVTDLSTGRESFMGTLRYGVARTRLSGVSSFVEDFFRDQPTCLDQAVRSAAFRRLRLRNSGGEWIPVSEAILRTGSRSDAGNPGTPHCANYDARPHPDGLEVVMGGTTMGDPLASRDVEIPD